MSRPILNPELLWIGRDSCYRLNPLAADVEGGAGASASACQRQALRPVGQFDEEEEEEEGEGGNCDRGRGQRRPASCYYTDEVEDQLVGCQIQAANGGFRMPLQVASAFHGFLIGKHGDAKRRLEAETGAEVRVPRMGDTDSPVIVQAKTRAQLASAKTRIDLIIEGAKDRLPITHFLSVRLASDRIVGRYKEFCDGVLRWCGGERGVTERVFQQPARLHVTCVPLLLLTAAEVAKAKKLLDEFAAEEMPRLVDYKGRGPLNVGLRGLEIMNDDPSDTRVLYACVAEPDGRLQAIADALAVKFAPMARVQPGREGVKLHVTLMNAKFSEDQPSDDRESRSKASFDAVHLLNKFANFDFGSAVVDSLQLSKSSGGAPKNEYYACEHSVPLRPPGERIVIERRARPS